MGAKWKVALVAGVLGVGAWSVWSVTRGDPLAPARDDVLEPATAELVEPDDPIAPAPDEELARTTADAALDDVAQAAPATTGSLLLRASWEATGEVAPGRTFLLLPWDAPEPFRAQREHLTDEAGELYVEGLTPGKLLVYGDVGGGGAVTITAGETTVFECVIPRGLRVVGVVVDADGAAVEGASIWVSGYGNTIDGRVLARSDADGFFELPSVPRGHHVSALAAGHGPSFLEFIEGEPGDELELRLRLARAGGELAGRVLGPDGAPLANVEVRFLGRVPDQGGTTRQYDAEIAPYDTRSDAQGRFQFTGLSVGTGRLLARAPRCAPATHEVDIAADEPVFRELRLVAAPAVSGTIRDEHGEPVAGVQVLSGEYARFSSSMARSAADGRYSLTNLPIGPVELRAEMQDVGSAAATFILQPGATETWDITLDPGGRLSGRVVDSFGAPLEGLWIDLASRHPARAGSRVLWSDSQTTDAQGRFAFVGMVDDTYSLRVHEQPFAPIVLYGAEELVPDGPELTITLTADAFPSASISGRIHAPGGKPVRVRMSAYSGAPGSRSFDFDSAADGSFRVGPLVAGKCTLRAEWPTGRTQLLGRYMLAADQELELGRVDLVGPGRVEVEVAGHVGFGPYETLTFMPSSDEGAPPALNSSPVSFDGHEADAIELLPGWYQLRAVGPDVAVASVLVVVDEDGGKVELDPRPGAPVQLGYRVAEGLQVSFVAASVTAADGRGVQAWSLVVEQRAGVFGTVRLEPGDYTLRLRTRAGGPTAERAFSVESADSPLQVLELTLE